MAHNLILDIAQVSHATVIINMIYIKCFHVNIHILCYASFQHQRQKHSLYLIAYNCLNIMKYIINPLT